MEWLYNDCKVEIDLIPHGSVMVIIVEIRCPENPPVLLTSTERFTSRPDAERYGRQLARKWIDERSADSTH